MVFCVPRRRVAPVQPAQSPNAADEGDDAAAELDDDDPMEDGVDYDAKIGLKNWRPSS